jgi:ABC-type nitrate/sulfonate/bicarbonate transport system substrate-binding protein
MTAACALAAPGRSAAAPRMELEPVLIEVPGAENMQFFNLWVALGAGYFELEGLAPRIVVAKGPRTTGDLLLNGRADVALLPPPMFLGMMAEDKPIVLFASLLANEPINLIVRKEIAEARRLSEQQTLAARLQAMKGLRVGLAGEVSPRLKTLAARAGLDAEKDFRLAVVPGPDQVEAFAGGKVDALFAHTPYLETALVEHGAVLVAETSSGAVPELADGQIHALATTRRTAQAKAGLIEAITLAIAQAQQLIHTDLKATVDAVIASGAAGSDRRLIETIAAVYAPAVPRTPEISIEGILRDASLYPAHPRAPDFTMVDAARFVAPEFAAQALRPR